MKNSHGTPLPQKGRMHHLMFPFFCLTHVWLNLLLVLFVFSSVVSSVHIITLSCSCVNEDSAERKKKQRIETKDPITKTEFPRSAKEEL